MIRNLFALIIVVNALACSTTETLKHADSLVQNKWVLSTFEGNSDMKSLFGDKVPFLDFSADGALSGNDGCNNLNGNVGADFIKTKQLDLSRLASTRMACLDGASSQFSAMLSNVSSFSINENTLNLLGESGNTLASFVPSN